MATKKKEVKLEAPVVKECKAKLVTTEEIRLEKLEKEVMLLRLELENLKKSITPNSTTVVPTRGTLV